MRIVGRLLGAAIAAAIALGGGTASAERRLPLELLLAVDVSASVDAEEFELQKQGIVQAFAEESIMQSILSQGGIAVAVMFWSGATAPRPLVVGWSVLSDGGGIESFIAAVARLERPSGFPSSTAIGNAIESAVRAVLDNGIEGGRRVIDIASDGKVNDGRPVTRARDLAASRGITVNGLAVLGEEPDLEDYFRANVVTSDGFVKTAASYRDFIESMEAKLRLEIAGLAGGQAAGPSVP